MALRFVLLGLVATLGFDAPDGSDLSRWAEAGRTWVLARVDDLNRAGRGEVERSGEVAGVLDGASKAGAGSSDLTCETVADSVARDLAADVAANLPPAPAADAPVVLFAENVEVGPTPPPTAPEATAAVEPSGPPAPVMTGPVDNTPAARITSAVRLTREAVFAWASVMDGAHLRADALR